MKKISLTLVIMVLAGTLSFAQSGFHLGFKFIPQTSYLLNQDDSDDSNVDYVRTYRTCFGPSASFHFAETTGIGLDVLFSSQGQKYDTPGGEVDVRLNYTKIPLTLKFTSDPESFVMFAGELGPQIGFLSAAESKSGGTTTDVKNRYSSTDFSAMFAMGVALKFTEFLQMTIQARIDYGFTDAEDKDDNAWLVAPGGADRVQTNNLTGGVAIGIYYVLGM